MAVKGLNQNKKTKKKRNDDDDDDDDDGHLAHLTYNIARSAYTLFHTYTEHIHVMVRSGQRTRHRQRSQ